MLMVTLITYDYFDYLLLLIITLITLITYCYQLPHIVLRYNQIFHHVIYLHLHDTIHIYTL